VRRGIAFCAEDRKTDGIIAELSVRENIVLAVQRRLARLGIVSRRQQLAVAEKFIDLLGIVTTGPEQPVGTLSGGNQQKVILARWLATDPRLLILDEPTRGIDVGAKAEIERLVEELSQEGMAVVFISSELEEVVRRSHRVAVLRDRRKIAELTGDDIDEHTIMHTIAEAGDHAS
jgi:ABC-type sugar transport system ATPase subunit